MRYYFSYYKKLKINSSENVFYNKYLNLSQDEFFKTLAIQYNIQFDYELQQTLPFYELVEYIIRAFNLVEHSDAYVQYFLDEVLKFTQNKTTGISRLFRTLGSKKRKD